MQFAGLPGAGEPSRPIEQGSLKVASKRLADVARRERKPDQVAFANQLWLHARIEEEVLYPAALLIGEYLRIAPDRKHTASKP